MTRVALATALVLALGACRGGRATGPAWPASAGTVAPESYEDDGGESIAPRGPVAAVAALEEARDASPAAADKPPATAAPPTTVPPTATTEKTAPIIETIEIELEDIQLGPGDIIITP